MSLQKIDNFYEKKNVYLEGKGLFPNQYIMMVSNANDDLPEPERPVITVKVCFGMSIETFLRLCSPAPRILI